MQKQENHLIKRCVSLHAPKKCIHLGGNGREGFLHACVFVGVELLPKAAQDKNHDQDTASKSREQSRRVPLADSAPLISRRSCFFFGAKATNRQNDCQTRQFMS
jgi:hypothetical protein